MRYRFQYHANILVHCISSYQFILIKGKCFRRSVLSMRAKHRNFSIDSTVIIIIIRACFTTNLSHGALLTPCLASDISLRTALSASAQIHVSMYLAVLHLLAMTNALHTRRVVQKKSLQWRVDWKKHFKTCRHVACVCWFTTIRARVGLEKWISSPCVGNVYALYSKDEMLSLSVPSSSAVPFMLSWNVSPPIHFHTAFVER